MPYHKNKQQAFQAAQQGFEEVKNLYENLNPNSPEYGHVLKRLNQEIVEARQQIESAHEVASETQRKVLEKYESELDQMTREIE